MIAVIGAASPAGAAFCRALKQQGRPFVPVVRNAAHWIFTSITTEAVFADLEDAPLLAQRLAGAEIVVHCGPARFVPAVLAAAPGGARLLLLGCVKNDASAEAFRASGRAGTMLRTSAIYGTGGLEDAVQRLAAALGKNPLVSLPEGVAQPIHLADLSACLLAVLDSLGDTPEVIDVAGPAALPMAEFLAAVARTAGAPAPRTEPVLLDRMPFRPKLAATEIEPLAQPAAIDIAPMQARFGLTPRPFAA